MKIIIKKKGIENLVMLSIQFTELLSVQSVPGQEFNDLYSSLTLTLSLLADILGSWDSLACTVIDQTCNKNPEPNPSSATIYVESSLPWPTRNKAAESAMND